MKIELTSRLFGICQVANLIKFFSAQLIVRRAHKKRKIDERHFSPSTGKKFLRAEFEKRRISERKLLSSDLISTQGCARHSGREGYYPIVMIRPGEKFSISRMKFLFRRGKSGSTIGGKIPRSADCEEDNFCNCRAL